MGICIYSLCWIFYTKSQDSYEQISVKDLAQGLNSGGLAALGIKPTTFQSITQIFNHWSTDSLNAASHLQSPQIYPVLGFVSVHMLLAMSLWVSSGFFGFLPTPQNVPVDGMANINCPLVWMILCMWVYGVLRWTAIPSRMYSRCSDDRLRIHCDPSW